MATGVVVVELDFPESGDAGPLDAVVALLREADLGDSPFFKALHIAVKEPAEAVLAAIKEPTT